MVASPHDAPQDRARRKPGAVTGCSGISLSAAWRSLLARNIGPQWAAMKLDHGSGGLVAFARRTPHCRSDLAGDGGDCGLHRITCQMRVALRRLGLGVP